MRERRPIVAISTNGLKSLLGAVAILRQKWPQRH
jgi:hypothetical protein